MSEQSVVLARAFLEKAGVRPTLNRILVLSAVAESTSPLTATEIYAGLLKEQRINRVTVYRILDLLSEKGVINRISTGERSNHFCMGRGHGHFHCTSCGKVSCILDSALGIDEASVARALGMTVSSVDLQVEGLCADCRKSSK